MRIAIAAAAAAALVACREPAPRAPMIPLDLLDPAGPAAAPQQARTTRPSGSSEPTIATERLADGYGGEATVKDLLADLLYQGRAQLPTAGVLIERYAPRAASSSVNGAETRLELGGEVESITIRENPSGVGASIRFHVAEDPFIERRALADVESIVETKRGRNVLGVRNENAAPDRAAAVVGCVELGDHVMQVSAEVTSLSGVKEVIVRFERQRRC